MLLQTAGLPPFLRMNNIPWCTNIIILLSTDTSCFHMLAVVNNAVLLIYWLLNVRMWPHLCLSGVRWDMPGHWVARSGPQPLALDQDKLQRQESLWVMSFIQQAMPPVVQEEPV